MLPRREQHRLQLREVIKEFQRFPGDVGSSEVQVARLTRKIHDLAEHLKVHRKDHSSRRGLQGLLSQRRSLLQYLRRSNFDTYAMTISKLGLKDNYAQNDRFTVRYKPLDYECLVEFIAVTPTARGQGVGTALLRWAEEVAVAGLLQRWPLSVRAMGHITMTLWVAADNAPATSMYARQGYATTSRTDCGVCACLHARLLTSFLGHPVWAHMSRQVPVPPEALAALPPAAMARGGASAREELVEVSLHSSSAGAGKTAAPGPLLAAALKRRQGSGGQEIALTEQRIGALAGVRQVSGAVGPSPSPSRAWTSGSEDLPAAPLVLYGGEGRGGGQSEGGGGTAAPVTGWSEGLGVPIEDTPEPGAFPDPVLALPRSEHGSWC
ncbi:37S ribosomal protein S28, mitochondrial [Auxenochlorella protothecoides]|uniref:Small ribosomal subunit protein uS15c n=1 Tax=Auxenochlorella protothecoides TaxID=3075 RepID=A0A087SH69_AUXPR|nr:37S ribosomal protein S28, mitochondrial [Auxenochlorella protothecoides]KFM25073.1 37S ribosomal protein S28, mitochondrial [Auxenochlorella protothecoides]